MFRIALANLPFPTDRHDAVRQAESAIAKAGRERAQILCFPECFLPGFRTARRSVDETDPEFLEAAWTQIGVATAEAGVHVILGTERWVGGQRRISALVFDRDGTRLGFQDKVQMDPSEESTYAAGVDRRVFQAGPATFGVVICHEGWRYPETVRWAVRKGAQIVFHPQFHEAEGASHRPTTYGEPANTFHEKAVLCRAAENTCYVASVNYAGEGSPTTSVIARPDGTVVAYQPYGHAGLLVADLDLSVATRLLAMRYKPTPP